MSVRSISAAHKRVHMNRSTLIPPILYVPLLASSRTQSTTTLAAYESRKEPPDLVEVALLFTCNGKILGRS